MEGNRGEKKPKHFNQSKKGGVLLLGLIPPQPCENEFILEHIAHRSLARVDGGWSWKFDDYLFDGFELGNIAGELDKVTCRLAVIYGEHSALFPPEVIAHTTGLLRNRAPLITI